MKNTFYPIVILLFVLISSCSNKEVQLPTIESDAIPEIHNHSSIWIFYELKNQDTLAILNKNNKILNTHWIFNIDKRLPMKKVVPLLQKMQEDKNKDSMHKKEGMLNYFSYANTASKNISLIHFNPTAFIFTSEAYQSFIKNEHPNGFIELDIQNDALFLESKKIEIKQLSQKLKDLKSRDTLKKLIVKYNENTSYQNYLKTKVFLNKTEIQIDSTEYIYSLK